MIDQQRREARRAAGDLLDVVRDGVIDLAVDAIRDRLRRSLPTLPSFCPCRF